MIDNEMIIFLESIRRTDNTAMIEAAINGYNACFEEIQWKNVALGLGLPAAAVVGGGMYGMDVNPLDHINTDKSHVRTVDDTQKQDPSDMQTVKVDNKDLKVEPPSRPAKATSTASVNDAKDKSSSSRDTTVHGGKDGLPGDLYSSGTLGKIASGGLDLAKKVGNFVSSIGEDEYTPIIHNELGHIQDRITHDKETLKSLGWKEVPLSKLRTRDGLFNITGFDYNRNFKQVKELAQRDNVDIGPAKCVMVSPSGMVVYSVLTNRSYATFEPTYKQHIIGGIAARRLTAPSMSHEPDVHREDMKGAKTFYSGMPSFNQMSPLSYTTPEGAHTHGGYEAALRCEQQIQDVMSKQSIN